MAIRSLLLMLVLCCSASLQAATHKLLILGDSLSAGYGIDQQKSWVRLLQNTWRDQGIHVINGAISGDTTDGGLARLPALLNQYQPDYVLIELGGNDGLQGHPVANIQGNLEKIIKLVRQHHSNPILQQVKLPPNYGKRYTKLFSNLYPTLARQYNLPLIAFFMDDIAIHPQLMQADGIHPNTRAQSRIAAFMQEKLAAIIQPDVASGSHKQPASNH